MKKKLAIACANKAQELLIRTAREMGIETHCFAWDKGVDSYCKNIADYYHPISTTEKEQILEVCREIGINGITSVANDPSMPTVCYVAENMGLISNRYEDALVMTNKCLVRQLFEQHGVNSPRYVLASEDTDYSAFRFPVIVKPADRCGSIGVIKVEKKEDLQSAILRAREKTPSGLVIVEEYLTGSEVSIDVISYNGEHFPLSIVDVVTTGAPYFVEIAYHEPSRLSPESQKKILKETHKALNAINFKYGASDVGIKLTDEGEASLIEINPRMGGDCTGNLVALSTNYNFCKGVIDVALGQFEKPVITNRKYAGIYYLSKETEHIKAVIENKDNDPDIIEATIYDNEMHNLQNSKDRSGYFIYQSTQDRKWEK